jgi:hypothetical protein
VDKAERTIGRGREVQPARARPRWWSVSHLLTLFCLWLVCGSAHAQEGIAVSRLVRTQAAQRLGHADAIVRGEAALVVAASADASLQATIRTLTTDGEEATRLRAILAMSCLAAPASVVVLERLLEDHQARVSHEGVVAAYALGMLPAELGGSATTRLLTSFTQTSWKRQRDVAMALLLGLSMQDASSQATVLQQQLRTNPTAIPRSVRNCCCCCSRSIARSTPRCCCVCSTAAATTSAMRCCAGSRATRRHSTTRSRPNSRTSRRREPRPSERRRSRL